MPTTDVAVDITPVDDTFTPYLDSIEASMVAALPAAFLAVYQAFLDIEKRRFDAEGPGWAELADSTVQQRGSAHPILDDTGALKKSLTSEHAKNSVFEPQVDGVFMGTSDPIAKYHQEGTEKMDARPVVDISEADAQVFADIIGEYLFEGASVVKGGALYAAGAMGL